MTHLFESYQPFSNYMSDMLCGEKLHIWCYKHEQKPMSGDVPVFICEITPDVVTNGQTAE